MVAGHRDGFQSAAECIAAGMYWFGQSDFIAAGAWWQRALELEPNNPRAQECLRLLQRTSSTGFKHESWARLPAATHQPSATVDPVAVFTDPDAEAREANPSPEYDSARRLSEPPLPGGSQAWGAQYPQFGARGSAGSPLADEPKFDASPMGDSASLVHSAYQHEGFATDDIAFQNAFDDAADDSSDSYGSLLGESTTREVQRSEPGVSTTHADTPTSGYRSEVDHDRTANSISSDLSREQTRSGHLSSGSRDCPPEDPWGLEDSLIHPGPFEEDSSSKYSRTDSPCQQTSRCGPEEDDDGLLAVHSPWDDGPSRTEVVTVPNDHDFDAVVDPTPLPEHDREIFFNRGKSSPRVGSDDVDLLFGSCDLPENDGGEGPAEPDGFEDALSTEPSTSVSLASPETALEVARTRYQLHDFLGVVDALRGYPVDSGGNTEIRNMLAEARSQLLRMYEAKIGSLERIPSVLISREEVIWLNLDHRAGFILSQVDGTVTYDDLISLSGMPRLDTVRILAELIDQVVIGVELDKSSKRGHRTDIGGGKYR